MAINPKIFRQVRKALGLTQQELADALGLSRVTVNKMEKGKLKRGIPDAIGKRLMELKPRPHAYTTWDAETKQWEGARPANVNTDDHLWDNEEEDES